MNRKTVEQKKKIFDKLEREQMRLNEIMEQQRSKRKRCKREHLKNKQKFKVIKAKIYEKKLQGEHQI